MNVPFHCRNISRNLCNYHVMPRRPLLKSDSKWREYPSICHCSISTSGNNITSLLKGKENLKYRSLAESFRRCYSVEEKPSTNKLPPLMNFPKIVWPSLIKSMRNFVLATFIIKPYLDREFNLPDFISGSKRAVEVVSHKLSSGDLKKLNGLVTSDILPNLQQNVAQMSLSQREQIAINVDDIYFSFPYQVGIIFNDEDTDQKRFVEITMVYHTLKGLAAMRERGDEPPLNMGMLPEYQNRISICNYRFVREFTKGVDSEWTVNSLNHFKPIDEQE
ncbi:unnamed protein product [Brassicogethes aeneus]|uniref:Uncharacterized protein n=1 Tax=Brassicogethes aeneus TaxID=1431903 RepID=A0A9P0FEP1_BRAAE|nr:unnamed protein product [Brassicogethes aeneus]